MSRSVPVTDIYAILSGWARAQNRRANQTAMEAELSTYLEQSAEALAQSLSSNNTVQVQLKDHGLNIDQALQHDAVIAWQALRKTPEVYESIPERCPQCDHLLTQWHCTMCGLELSRWKAREGYFTDSMGVLPWGYTLTVDPRRRRIIFLHLSEQAAPRVVWQINFPMEFMPQSAQLISAGEILVSSEQGHLHVVDLFGEVLWSSSLAFKKPVQVQAIFNGQQRQEEGSVQRFLVVDEELHQVFIVNRKHEMLWSYGTPHQAGKESGLLRSPLSACLSSEGQIVIADTGNRRIIEVSEVSKTVRRSLLESQRIEAPSWCEALPNGHINIIDTVHYRFYDLDSEGEINSSCAYYQDNLDLRYRVKDACLFLRRENGHVLIGNRERLVEISPGQKRLLWYIPLTELRLAAHQSKTQPYTPPKKNRGQ